MLLCLAAQAQQKTNPHTQINWPANCSSTNYMIYNWLANTCINAGPVGASGQIQVNQGGTWAVVPGLTYDFINNILQAPNANVSGKVGIRTTTPAAPLDVNGLIHAVTLNADGTIQGLNLKATSMTPGAAPVCTAADGTLSNAACAIPPGSVSWPPSCSSGTYVPATNTCVPTGTAANPGGSTGQVQYNAGGTFGGFTYFVNCAGVSDTAVVQTALNAKGHILLVGNCLFPAVAGVLTISSDTWLDAGLATITCNLAPCIQNTQAAQTVQRTFSDAVLTVGSTTITSATANFTSADIGRVSIRCTGGIASIPGIIGYPGIGSTTLSTTIAVVTNATTAILADAPSASLNPSTCTTIVRDHNITVTGGKWIMANPVVSSSTIQHLAFVSVIDLNLRDMWFQNGATGLPTSSGSKNIGIGDAARVRVSDITFNSWQTLQDGIDLYGPLREVVVRDIAGHTGDNSVAVLPFSIAPMMSPGQGVIDGILVESINTAAGFGAIRFFGNDTGSPIYMNDVTIRHFHGASQYSNGTLPGGSGDGVELYYGYFDNVLVDDVSGLEGQQAVKLAGGNFGNLTVKNLSIQPTAAAAALFYAATGNTAGVGPTITNLVLDGLKISGPPSLNMGYLVNFGQASTFAGSVNHLSIINSQFYNFNVTSAAFWFNGITIGDINFSNIKIVTNYGSTGNAVFVFKAGSFQRLSMNNVHVDHAAGSASSGGLLAMNNFGGVNVVPGDISMSDVSYTAPATLASPPYLIVNTTPTVVPYLLSNVRLNNVAGCVFNATTANTTAVISGLNASNLGTPASCSAAFNGINGQVIASTPLTNQTAAIATSTIATVPAGKYQYQCYLATGSTTGTGTATINVINPANTAWVTGPVLTFNANAVITYTPTFVIPAGTLRYRVDYTAGTGGSYNVDCGALRVQ